MEEFSPYRLVFDAIKDPLILAAPNGAVRFANAAARHLFDIDGPANVSSLECDDVGFTVDGDAVRDLTARYESVRDYALPGASGATLDIDTVQGEDGEAFKLFHIRIPSSGRDREFWRDEMIALVSHEIKNPLSAMKHSVDILLSGTPGELTEGQRRFLGTSGRSIERLTHLLDGFLDVSRIRSGAFHVHRSRIDVRQFVHDITASFTTLFNVRGVGVECNVDDGVGEAYVDGPKLEQVMYNLLSNALKHTPEGGRIRIDVAHAGVEAVAEDLTLLPWRELGAPRFLAIRVDDNGLGMSTETLDAIFERHHGERTDERPRGAHLGLSISKALVEAQGGRLEVESTVGIGTTVTLHVPETAATACVIERVSRARDLVERCRRSKRSAAVYAIGKSDHDNWNDIALAWEARPAVNPAASAATGETRAECDRRMQLWTIDDTLAIAVAPDRSMDDAVDATFVGEAVECDDGAWLFGPHAVGVCCNATESSAQAPRGFAQLCSVAVERMGRAQAAAARVLVDEADLEYVLNNDDWTLDS